MARNTEGVVAIELLSAAQAVDLQDGGPLPERLQQVYAGVRERSATMVVDRAMSPDIEAVRAWLRTDDFMDAMPEGLLPSYS
jgi:histidine ammonia-lyase